MNIKVIYGRHDDLSNWDACPRCQGEGEAEPYWQAGHKETCRFCTGTGRHPHPPGYRYSTSESVTVGDVVLCPGNWHVPEPQEATVVAVNTDRDGYDGPISGIIRVVTRS